MKLGKLEGFSIKQTMSVPSKALNSFMRQKQVKFSFSRFLIQDQGPARFVQEPNNKAKFHWNHFIYSFLNLLESSSGIVLEWTTSTSVKIILYLMSLQQLTSSVASQEEISIITILTMIGTLHLIKSKPASLLQYFQCLYETNILWCWFYVQELNRNQYTSVRSTWRPQRNQRRESKHRH